MPETPETRASLLVRMRDPTDGYAWGEFVQIYEPLVYRFARGQRLQDADAQDLTQQVLMAVARRVDQWKPERPHGSFRAWLFRVARNLMVNLMINRRRHPPGLGDTDFQKLLESEPDSASDEAEEFDVEYRRHTFRWAADQIRGEFRQSTWDAFWQTSVDGVEAKAVAEALGISIGAVYIARSRVLARLRQKIERLEGH